MPSTVRVLLILGLSASLTLGWNAASSDQSFFDDLANHPGALVRHYHRRELDGLRQQLVGYGTGLTAMYTALLLHQPSVLFPLLRLVPTALHDLIHPESPRHAGLGPDFPRELLSANRRGMLRGPAAYLRSRSRRGRATQPSAPPAMPAAPPASR